MTAEFSKLNFQKKKFSAAVTCFFFNLKFLVFLEISYLNLNKIGQISHKGPTDAKKTLAICLIFSYILKIIIKASKIDSPWRGVQS